MEIPTTIAHYGGNAFIPESNYITLKSSLWNGKDTR